MGMDQSLHHNQSQLQPLLLQSYPAYQVSKKRRIKAKDDNVCVDKKNDKGWTPLCLAVYNSEFDRARELLKDGANINAPNNNNNTILHELAHGASVARVKFLLYHGADADVPNNKGKTAYHIALKRRGILKTFQECREIIFSPEDSIVDDRRFNSGMGKSLLMQFLADDGRYLKNLLMLNSAGYCSGDIVIAENILQKCHHTVWSDFKSNFSCCSKETLRIASSVAQRSLARKELDTALLNNNFPMVKILLSINPYLLHTYQGEYYDDDTSSLFVQKVLSTSVLMREYSCIKKLLDQGFDLNMCDAWGKSLLCRLVMDANDEIKYRDVLKAGVSVNTLDNSGRSPLSYAVLLGDTNKVMTLLRYGAVVLVDMFKTADTVDLFLVLNRAYSVQLCCVCETNPENITNIPCVNRHIGSFICKDCYDRVYPQCPLCKRLGSLDKYGA